MNILNISKTLLEKGICSNTKSANSTALIAINWMYGEDYSAKIKSNHGRLKTHRARLRRIGIDIAKPCNISIFNPVTVREVKQITRQPLQQPDFYRHPVPNLDLVEELM